VAPTDRFQLPLRWQFVPVENPAERSITQCMQDAEGAGYGGR
jgi:hypothetical protein